MSNDPLDAVFVTGDEAAELKRDDLSRKLATYLERMPAELRGLFTEEFQHISIAELAQLRADLQAAQERIVDIKLVKKLAQQVTDETQTGHNDAVAGAMTRLMAKLYESIMSSHEPQPPTLAQERSAEMARQLAEEREIIESCASLDRYVSDSGIEDARAWLAANPAPEAEPQP